LRVLAGVRQRTDQRDCRSHDQRIINARGTAAMNHATRFAITGAVVAMLGLSACVWDHEGDRGRGRGGMQQQRNDRDGRPCEQRGQGGAGRHDEDCGPRNH
jgi:hypothetical protein